MLFKRIVLYSLALALAFPAAYALASVDGVISAQVQLNDRRSVGINTNANLSVNAAPSLAYTDGVGANQGNIVYQASLAMTSGAYALDLAGAVADSYGTTVAAVRIKGIYVKNTSAHTITMGAGSATMTTLLNSTGTLTLPSGAFFCAGTPDATGWVVTATTADTLNFTGTTTDTFQVVILGGKT